MAVYGCARADGGVSFNGSACCRHGVTFKEKSFYFSHDTFCGGAHARCYITTPSPKLAAPYCYAGGDASANGRSSKVSHAETDKNGPDRSIKYHPSHSHGRELAASDVAFRPAHNKPVNPLCLRVTVGGGDRLLSDATPCEKSLATTTDGGFVEAQSDSLPEIDTFMMTTYFANIPDFTATELRRLDLNTFTAYCGSATVNGRRQKRYDNTRDCQLSAFAVMERKVLETQFLENLWKNYETRFLNYLQYVPANLYGILGHDPYDAAAAKRDFKWAWQFLPWRIGTLPGACLGRRDVGWESEELHPALACDNSRPQRMDVVGTPFRHRRYK
ncbi:hypothetical protein EVAR_54710_1 [Eumeta japonica]|uniref:Uncharacterized protein n=1 Tax=Eumeta variegata TaxID=151549 RepID=A0A4C1YMG7_EUMVA|nr:hypothetical protein EVAR_54710_1 [Eumeta japonica]